MYPETIALVIAIVFIVAGAMGVAWNELRRRRKKRSASRMPPEYFEALAFMLGEQTDRALEVFLDLAGRESDTVELHFALGNLFRRKGEIERATLIHQNLIARPTLSRTQRDLALKELGQDYLSAGLYDRAEKIFGDLIDLKTHQIEAAQSLILIYEQQQDWEQAAAFRRRLEWLQGTNERKVIAHYYCEIALKAQSCGDETTARDALVKARRNDRDCARVRLLTAQVAILSKDTRRAMREYRAVLEHEPGLAEIVLPALADLFPQGAQADEFDAIVHDLLKKKPGAFLAVAVAGLLHEILRCPSVLEAIEQEMKHLIISPLSKRGIWPPEGAHEVRAILIWLLSDWLERRRLYQCSSCGFSAHELYWHCPGCRGWDSMRMRSDVFPVPSIDMDDVRPGQGRPFDTLSNREVK
jgi:lipopolysaccharide biosynthesis regulator YciM